METTLNPTPRSRLCPPAMPIRSPGLLRAILSLKYSIDELTDAVTSRKWQQLTSQPQTQVLSSLRGLAISFPKAVAKDLMLCGPRPIISRPPLSFPAFTSPVSLHLFRLASQPAFRPESASPEEELSSDDYRNSSTRSMNHQLRNSSSLAQSPSVNSDDVDNEVPVSISLKNELDLLMQVREIGRWLGIEGSYRPLLHALGQGDLAQEMMDLCQSALEVEGVFDSKFGRTLLVFMQRLSRSSRAVPASYDLGCINVMDKELVNSGSFGDVYKTQLCERTVCVKKIRVIGLAVDDERTKKLHKQLVNEGILWWQLRHPNVLPFYGVCRHSVLPFLVSPWMEHGDINKYIKHTPDANRYLLLNDVLKGLDYLHNLDLIHGDLKGANILVDSHGRAALADFGLSSVFDITIPRWESHSTAASKGGTRRWQAPELFDPAAGDKEFYNTRASDIYAWACVCYEVFLEKPPFYEILRCEKVMLVVMDGGKPTRPRPDHNAWQIRGLRDDFWSDMMEKCWARDPNKRPTVQELLANDIWALVSYDAQLSPCGDETSTKHDLHGSHAQQPAIPESLCDIVSRIFTLLKKQMGTFDFEGPSESLSRV